MKAIFFILISTSFLCIAASETYGDVAKDTIPGSYNKFLDNLHILHEGVKPGTLGNLRRSIISLRSYLDVFTYAYPFNNLHDTEDVFLHLRKDLNKLYTSIGNFDDLHFVNYSPHDAEKLLDVSLKDKVKFETNDRTYGYVTYVKSPSKKLMYPRDKALLSIDFWGKLDAVPLAEFTAQKNLAILALGQINKLISDYTQFTNLTDICNEEVHTQFHDYRKLLRGFNFVGSDFGYVFNKTINLGILSESYHSIGKINDEINEYIFYMSKGNENKAIELKKKVKIDWDKLKSWFNSVKLYDIMVRIRNSII
jgi:hypothetical protein